MKRKNRSPKSSKAQALRTDQTPAVRPIGPPIKLHKEQYLELKTHLQAAQLAQQSAQQTLALAQQTVNIAQQSAATAQGVAVAYAKKLGLPDGQLGFNDATHSVQRLAVK